MIQMVQTILVNFMYIFLQNVLKGSNKLTHKSTRKQIQFDSESILRNQQLRKTGQSVKRVPSAD